MQAPSASNKAPTGEAGGAAPSTSDEAFDAEALFLSQAALEATGKHIGDEIALSADGRALTFRIAGTLPGVADNQNIAVMDIAAAQWRFGSLGRLQRIDLKLADGADATRVRNALAAILPAAAEIVSQETETRRTDSLSRAYRVNLDMLALMALLTGAFLAFSAQALSVARRRSQFALLRVLGVQRRAILLQVLAEGAVVGGIGAIVGLGLGLGLADVALRFLGGDLGGGYFYGTRPQLIFAPEAALGFLLLGVLAALLGSVLPARDAARAQPAIALKDAGDAADANAIPGALIALALLLAGAVARVSRRSTGFRCSAMHRSRFCWQAASRRCRCLRESCSRRCSVSPSPFPPISPRSISGALPRKRPSRCAASWRAPA